MNNDNEFLKILNDKMLNSFDMEVEKLAQQTAIILENQTRTFLLRYNEVEESNSIRLRVKKLAANYLVSISSYSRSYHKFRHLKKQCESTRVKGFAASYSERIGAKATGILKKHKTMPAIEKTITKVSFI
jgi:hypothetical protein